MGRRPKSASAFNPGHKPMPPTHDRRGPVCNVEEGCGRPAHYVHGSKAGCDKPEHKEFMFALCRKVRRADKVELPEVKFEVESEEAWAVPERIG